MKVTLVQPNSASVIKAVLETTGVPLGLAYLGAALREEHEVRIIDALTLDYDAEELKMELKKHEPDVVGITATTPAVYDSYEVGRLAKGLNPDVKTVIGGPHVTFMAKETLEDCPALDMVVRNEGELTFKELLDAFKKGTPLKNIAGISFRKEGE
nr:methyltransferase Fe-S oxidoreductase [uncultured archaeon GZfos3D4]